MVIAVPIRAIDYDFVIVPSMIVVMVLVIVRHPGGTANAAYGNEHSGHKN